jgi:hypothetical protein
LRRFDVVADFHLGWFLVGLAAPYVVLTEVSAAAAWTLVPKVTAAMVGAEAATVRKAAAR